MIRTNNTVTQSLNKNWSMKLEQRNSRIVPIKCEKARGREEGVARMPMERVLGSNWERGEKKERREGRREEEERKVGEKRQKWS